MSFESANGLLGVLAVAVAVTFAGDVVVLTRSTVTLTVVGGVDATVSDADSETTTGGEIGALTVRRLKESLGGASPPALGGVDPVRVRVHYTSNVVAIS